MDDETALYDRLIKSGPLPWEQLTMKAQLAAQRLMEANRVWLDEGGIRPLLRRVSQEDWRTYPVSVNRRRFTFKRNMRTGDTVIPGVIEVFHTESPQVAKDMLIAMFEPTESVE